MNDLTEAVRCQLLELHGAAERIEMLVGGGLPTLAGAELLVGLARLRRAVFRKIGPGSCRAMARKSAVSAALSRHDPRGLPRTRTGGAVAGASAAGAGGPPPGVGSLMGQAPGPGGSL
jgi:hypothetical protein